MKFSEKALSHMALAYYYSAMQAFTTRIATVHCDHARFQSMLLELQRLWTAFDDAYKSTQKSLLSNQIKQLDDKRDQYAAVLMGVSKLWAEKMDDPNLNAHGKRVYQVFKNFDFRTTEAVVAENAKALNIEQQFHSPELEADLQTMGLTEINLRFHETTLQLISLISLRNEEQSQRVAGEIKSCRSALNEHYQKFITFLNAVQELQPEESISQAAKFYNEDLRRIELQISQSNRKKGSSKSKSSEKKEDAAKGAASSTTQAPQDQKETDSSNVNSGAAPAAQPASEE